MLSARTRDSLSLGPWRRRRRMARLLRELDDLDLGRRRRRSSIRGNLSRRLLASAVAAVLIVVIGGMFAHKQLGLTIGTDGLALARPLGNPPVVSSRGGSFGFTMVQTGSQQPVAYDPCRPVEYVVNDAAAPPGASALLKSAVAEISAATGLVFTPVGTTRKGPPDYARSLHPPRREPVHVTWTTPEIVNDLAGRVAGVGGSVARADTYTGELRYVTGTVALDAPQLTEVLARANGPAQVRAIMVHELGHLVGLDHVDDTGELMYADNVGRLTLGPGDRRGLAKLGGGRCFH